MFNSSNCDVLSGTAHETLTLHKNYYKSVGFKHINSSNLLAIMRQHKPDKTSCRFICSNSCMFLFDSSNSLAYIENRAKPIWMVCGVHSKWASPATTMADMVLK